MGKTVVTRRTGLSGSSSLSQINYSVLGTPITGGGRGELTNTSRSLSLVPCFLGGDGGGEDHYKRGGEVESSILH